MQRLSLVAVLHTVKAVVRRLTCHFDPLPTLSTRKADKVFSTGRWVDRMLRLKGGSNTQRKSQIGLDDSVLRLRKRASFKGLSLVTCSRLDQIKGVDLVQDELTLLPYGASSLRPKIVLSS